MMGILPVTPPRDSFSSLSECDVASKSKKRSDASSGKRPETVVFFIDRESGKRKIADAHTYDFEPEVKDDQWLTESGNVNELL